MQGDEKTKLHMFKKFTRKVCEDAFPWVVSSQWTTGEGMRMWWVMYEGVKLIVSLTDHCHHANWPLAAGCTTFGQPGWCTHWRLSAMATVLQTTFTCISSNKGCMLIQISRSLVVWVQSVESHHWFRQWHGAWMAPSHCLYQRWRIYRTPMINVLNTNSPTSLLV